MTDEELCDQILEENLLESVSRTHSLIAFLQSFSLDILVYGSVFVAGYHKVSPNWLIPPLIMLVIKDVWSSERESTRFREIITILRDEDKHLLLADLNQLPPWVHFPDVERCNWLNQLLSQFWPHICNFVKEEITTNVGPALRQEVPGFKFQKVSLGLVPPTISGIKVYDKHVSSSQLLIDANLSYTGDSEISFTYRGIPGGIRNLELRGPVRIDFLILQTPPFVGGLEFSFLGHPQFDFILTGIGSVGFIEEIIRKLIYNHISSHLVFPKRFSTVWVERHDRTLTDPEGIIRINVVAARDLESRDRWFSKSVESDPYARVMYGKKKFWSRVIMNSNNPELNMWCEFVKDSENTVGITIWDKDKTKADDLIGACFLSVKDIQTPNKIDSWFPLEGSDGSVYVKAWFLTTSADTQHVKFPPNELSFLSSYVLTILVKSAHNLVLPRVMSKPSSSVQLTVGNDTQNTETVENDNNPVFDQEFTFLVNNPEFNKLRVKVVDTTDKSEIGSFSYGLRKLLDRKNLKISEQHFPLIDSASNSSIVVSMGLSVIKNLPF